MRLRFGVWWALFIASFKMFYRNRTALFFSLVLPLLIMVIFGVLNFEGAITLRVGVVDEAQTDASRAFRTELANVDYLELLTGSRADELEAIEAGDRDFVLVIPDAFAPTPDAASLIAFEATGDPQQTPVRRGLLQQAVIVALNGSPDAPAPASPVRFESVEARDLGYIDFLVPGVIGMTVMQLGLFGVAFTFVQFKRTGALRRLFATPTAPSYFLGAQVASRLIIAFVQVGILIGVGILFGLQMFGDWLTLAVIVVLGSMIFLAVGYAIAGWARNEDQAAPVANLVSLPMMFLSGVFFPREAMPDFLLGVTSFMPLTYVNDALRAVVNNGFGLASLGPQLLGMGVWALISFLLAVRLFKWE